jgi:pentatricopeptide repeat protein
MDLDRDYIKAQRLLIEKSRASGDEQELAVGLYELGKYFEGRGMYPLATSQLGEACQILKRLFPNDARTLSLMANLAFMLAKQGNIAAAEKLYDEMLSSRCHFLGWSRSREYDRDGEGFDQGNMAAVYIVRNKCVVRFQ